MSFESVVVINAVDDRCTNPFNLRTYSRFHWLAVVTMTKSTETDKFCFYSFWGRRRDDEEESKLKLEINWYIFHVRHRNWIRPRNVQRYILWCTIFVACRHQSPLPSPSSLRAHGTQVVTDLVTWNHWNFIFSLLFLPFHRRAPNAIKISLDDLWTCCFCFGCLFRFYCSCSHFLIWYIFVRWIGIEFCVFVGPK